MQARRAFSLLASKIHPQLPLDARESEQLLRLLTSSFRQHLDREHPISAPAPGQGRHSGASASTASTASKPSPHPSLASRQSSQSSASRHIEAILTNPLFAVQQPRRASDAAAIGGAHEALKDPHKWFLHEIAIGAADIPKAMAFLQLSKVHDSDASHNAVSIVADWLWSSNFEMSKAFVEATRFQDMLTSRLVRAGKEATLWRWYECSPDQRVADTGLDPERIARFRSNLLFKMVSAMLRKGTTCDRAVSNFMRAADSVTAQERHQHVVRSAGFGLIRHFISSTHSTTSPALYTAFLESVGSWIHRPQLLQSLLWLHHPSEPSAVPGLNFLRGPHAFESVATRGKNRSLAVTLCLGVAAQLLEQKRFADASWVLQFAQTNYPELVSQSVEEHRSADEHSTQKSTNARNSQEISASEQESLDLLNRLVPG